VDLRPGMGRNIFGCDICQDVCPWNREAPFATVPEFSREPQPLGSPKIPLVNPDLRRLARMTVEEFRAFFRHSPVKRAKYQGLMRNVIIAMGNSGDTSMIADLEAIAGGPDPLLCRHALWSLERLRKKRTKREIAEKGQ